MRNALASSPIINTMIVYIRQKITTSFCLHAFMSKIIFLFFLGGGGIKENIGLKHHNKNIIVIDIFLKPFFSFHIWQ